MSRPRFGKCCIDGLGRHAMPIGFGAFKIGRNEGAKYPHAYQIPTEEEASDLLHEVLDLGCNWIDTAPAYGLSEERIGRAVSHRRREFILSTKVGETFVNGVSTFDFSSAAIRASLERSLRRLQTDVLDVVLIHSNGNDQQILRETDVVNILHEFKTKGLVQAIGMSGKTIEGAALAMEWADILMVEYNLSDTTHAEVMTQAYNNGLGVLVKKGLSSGRLPATESIRFVLSHPGVTSLVIGGANLDHFRANWLVAVDLMNERG